jgi:hypothetical protein
MTVTIKQRTNSDCVLACIAMAAGKPFDELWTQADLDEVVKSKGISDYGPWLKRAGFVDGEHWHVHLYDGGRREYLAMLRGRRAIISVPSLNIDQGSHAVYWDGNELHDPSTMRTYCHLSSLTPTSAHIFQECGQSWLSGRNGYAVTGGMR